MHISRETIHIAVAESSVIIRNGISATLERISSIKAHIVEVASMEGLYDCMDAHSPDLLVVNPMFCGKFSLEQMKRSWPSVKYVALATSYIDSPLLAEYDGILSVYDSIDSIEKLFLSLSMAGEELDETLSDDGQKEGLIQGDDQPDVLSQREKEIVVCVVRGLTNKEIADELFLSVHTVITHRRNISRKLQIHSVAGLTIYAIANKLIGLEELK